MFDTEKASIVLKIHNKLINFIGLLIKIQEKTLKFYYIKSLINYDKSQISARNIVKRLEN